ncbi:MAG: hypothetical protein ACR2QF_08220 [Geminicoccaceae bacterium]
MIRFNSMLTLPVVVLLSTVLWSPASAEVRLGAGVHYWTALDDIEVDEVEINKNGASFIASLQWLPGGLVYFEGNLEYFDEGFGGADAGALAPQVFALAGLGSIYGGLGIGVTYNDELEGSNFSDPFYTLRAGLDFELLPQIHLDIHGNYIFNAFSDIDGASEDSITLGAIARLALW